MSWAIALHALSAVIWVGGMFFAYMAMRPAVIKVIEAQQRGALWCETFNLFFRWVWAAIALLLITGYWMIFKGFGGMAAVGWHVHAMQTGGIVMMLLFFHIYFSPFRRLKHAVASSDPQESGRQVGKIRTLVGINLVLGLVIVAIGSAGRYL